MEKVTLKNRHLLSFLKEKRALDVFIANYEKQGIKKTEISDPKANIDNVLIWRSTSEGFAYWSDLHDQWFQSKQYEAYRRLYPSICGYGFRKKANGFNLGCQHFTYSDVVKVAKEISKNSRCTRAISISGYRNVTITGDTATFNGHRFNVNDVNLLLRVYKLKQISVEQ